eukprot:CAMPEP_0172467474 /NCGR_PEP_ID=MMETSP1065-20121228/59044_1 /TAXON_ID=265537 /ORGANISM="Amphiprora paludosa, Strain CCMP125" /LENGTH=43 /DNA_ID= /DNA_START= /DNA_END= /DNA_ORIENTATION=
MLRVMVDPFSGLSLSSLSSSPRSRVVVLFGTEEDDDDNVPIDW